MNRRLSSVAVAVFVIGLTNASSVSAQVLGTFKWQFSPYCNVVSVRIEQKGSVFELTGTDDGCDGAAPASTVNGSAHVNTNGSVGISLAIVRPDGFVINNSISLSQTTLGGTWKDDWGNSGLFVPNPPSPVAGNPRTLTMRGDWSVLFPAAAAGNQGSSSISFLRPLPSAPAVPVANVIAFGGAPTANCPGSINDPQAAPGQLCVYERERVNVSQVRPFNAGTGLVFVANNTGFGVAVMATAAGQTFGYGRWAVTVP
jgi:hypothetical protein